MPATIAKFKPCPELLQEDPYPVYHQYRTSDPVHRGMPPWPDHDESWYLFRHDDVTAVLKSRLFINERQAVTHGLPCAAALEERKSLWHVLGNWVLMSDPPSHTRIRSTVSKAFTRRAVDTLTPLIQTTANHLLDKVIRNGQMDLVSDFSTPLPMEIISRLLGIRIDDPKSFKIWSHAIADAIDIGMNPDAYDRAMNPMTGIVEQLRNEFREKRQQPTDDLVSSLLSTMDDDNVINEDELISLCTMLMFAGQETAIDAISSSVLALLQNPEQLQMLRDNPELLPGAVEELLRYNSPLQMTVIRVAAEDVVLGDKQLRKGDIVTAVLGAANRDPEKFENPDQLDITRSSDTQSAVFGQGIHVCLGAHLARVEIRIALGTLLRRLGSIKLESSQLHWRNNVVFRGLTTLPISFEAT